MLRLLRTVSWRHVKRHRLRTFLTFLGIALGVAVIIAIALVNRSLTSSFQSTIEQIAGKAVLQVANAESGIPEELFPLIRDAAGVKDAAASVDGFLPLGTTSADRLYVFGVDLLTDFAIRDHQFAGAAFDLERALDFIAAPDSIAVSERFAARRGLEIGSHLDLITSAGRQVYIVRGLLKDEGTARVFGGNFALMDLPVAQRAFGKEGRIDVVDLTVEPEARIETVQQHLRDRLRGTAEVERPSKRGEQIESLLTSFRVGLFFVSLIALFVGFFLIYNTVSVSVVQRKKEIGTLRCLGMRRGELLRWIVAEALVIAAAGAAAGCVLGWLLSQAALVAVGETVRNLYSSIGLTGDGVSLRELGLAALSGVGVAVLAALHPALQAIRVSPLENARQTVWRPGLDGRNSRAARLGAVCFALAPLIVLSAPGLAGPVARFSGGVAGMLVLLLGVAFLCPLLVSVCARWFWQSRIAVAGLSRAETKLAVDSLRRNPVRSGITVATVVISLAAIFTIAAFVNSVRGSLLAWIDQMVTADLIVSSGARTAGPRNVSLSEAPLAGLEAIPGVRIVDLYRLIRSSYEGLPVSIESFSAAASGAVRTLPMAAGDGDSALSKMASGAGVIVSESFYSRFGKGTGDIVELATPSGLIPLRVLGVYIDYSSDIGSVLIDRALYKKYWRDDLVDAFDIWLEPAADQRAVIEAIRESYGEKYQLFISTHGELKDAVVRILEQSFVVNYAVEIVAVVVAVFSVINTLLASVLDRTREIGVLRAIGATQSQIRRMIVLEAASMGLMGGVLGLMAGTVMAYHHVVYNTKVLTGWTFQFFYPYDVALMAVLVSVVLCVLASFTPATQAASTPVVAAIGYE